MTINICTFHLRSHSGHNATVSPSTSSVEEGRDVDPEMLEYLVGRVFYGGRVHRAEDQQGITGLDRPEIFGLPAGVQQLQEIEAGQRFLTVLATVGGAQNLQGESERISKDEVKRLKKMSRMSVALGRLKGLELYGRFRQLPAPIEGEAQLDECEERDLRDVMRREINKYNAIVLGITREERPGDGTEEVISAVNLGHTPASWRALCKHPTPGTLHAFLQDFHARVDFFQTWLNNGCPKTYWLGAFQFLPAFLTTILRQVGQSTRRPLHHLTWGFHMTDEPPPEMPEKRVGGTVIPRADTAAPLLSMIPTPTVQTGSLPCEGRFTLYHSTALNPRFTDTRDLEKQQKDLNHHADRPSRCDHPSTEAQQTRFSDEFQNIKDSTSLDLQLGEETCQQ
ncbi:dynein heavy chain 7, axonemal-like [Penaeus vannamei]|uniref:Dynein heavy chain 7, axonemal-like n=1 Tax=Penaeus vannamei TaxID=6689 RepID=A0A423U1B5_PENVA|nr:dynein heavy chain 7, axonemal-like [Penaeus vannamei]